MCGFLGEVSFSGEFSDRTKFINSSKLLNHRGPDHFDYYTNNKNLQLGFNRLSIFDVSKNGNQPMNSKSGRFTIVFNGAIYNYQSIYEEIKEEFMWRGKSDTEVLLNSWEKWGPECLNKIDGMFSFAVWDNKFEKIYLCRDRVGEKPLYYFKKNSYIAFSSRPKPLIKLLPNILGKYNFKSIKYYLEAGHFPRSESFFSNINKLEPGCYLEFSKKNCFKKNYWDLRNINKKINNQSLERNVNELENLLISNLTKFIKSDRPLGFFLSGGIDSSLLVSIASKLNLSKKFTAFNLSFDDSRYDESEDAKSVAKKNNVDLKIKKLSHLDLIKNLDIIYDKFDEPFADPACFPLLEISKFAKSHVDVAITGDGGDELFGGYEYYRISKFFEKFKNPSFILLITKFLKFFNENHRYSLLYEAAKIEDSVRLFSFLRSYKKDFPSVLSDFEDTNNEISIYSEFQKSLKNLDIKKINVMNFMELDILHVLNDAYLQKSDLSTMANGLECRAPYLNREILEWSSKIPIDQKVKMFEKKIILRRLASKYLPKKIMKKAKKGFEMPIKGWLRDELLDWSRNLIFDKQNYNNLPIEMSKVKAIFHIHQSKKRDCHPYLWSILMLLHFNRENSKF
jgi:asparagine synthase (glutamine-hydrolysing)